jgi:hypothetical protein
MSNSRKAYYSGDLLPDLDALKKLIEEGDASHMPPHVAQYVEQLNLVRQLYDRYEGKKFIINTLKTSYPGTSHSRCLQLYADALNFFNSDNTVTREAWRNIYAQQLDDAALLALKKDDFSAFAKLKDQAAKLRRLYEEDKKEELPPARRPVVVYDLNPERLGMKAANRKELAVVLDSLKLPEDELARLEKEAGIKDFKLFEDEAKESD